MKQKIVCIDEQFSRRRKRKGSNNVIEKDDEIKVRD